LLIIVKKPLLFSDLAPFLSSIYFYRVRTGML